MISLKKSFVCAIFSLGMVGTVVCMNNNNNNVPPQGKTYDVQKMVQQLEADKAILRIMIEDKMNDGDLLEVAKLGKTYNKLGQMNLSFELMQQDGRLQDFEFGRIADEEIENYGARAQQQLQEEMNDFLEEQRLIREENAKSWMDKLKECVIL